MSERRNTARKRVLLEAKWDSMSGRHEARVDDLSLGGCFVNTYGPVVLNEPVTLQILTPSGEWLTVRGTAVTYQVGVGFGMSFGSLSAPEEFGLKNLITSVVERQL